MITALTPVSLSGLAVNDTKSIDWSSLVHLPISGVFPSIAVYNESGYGLTCRLNIGGQSFFLPAGAWQRVDQIDPRETGMLIRVVYILPNAPVSQLAIVYYDEDSPNTGPGMLGNSPISVSGSVNTASTSVVQDGQPNAQTIVEATPTGQPQNVLITTDGKATFTNAVNIGTNAGAPGTQIAALGHFTKIEGFATAGVGPGVGVVVAQVSHLHITSTVNTPVLAYTPTVAAGVFRVSGYLRYHNASFATAGPILQMTWFDIDDGLTESTYLSTVSTSPTPFSLIGGTNTMPNALNHNAILNVTIYASTGGAITISYQDPVGVPDDYLSFVIQRLV